MDDKDGKLVEALIPTYPPTGGVSGREAGKSAGLAPHGGVAELKHSATRPPQAESSCSKNTPVFGVHAFVECL